LRLFVAAPLPAALRASLLELQARLEAPLWELSLVRPEDFHLTLHFLGSTPKRVLDDLKRELGALCHARRPFDLALRGLGAFPNETEPRVLWTGVEDSHGRLRELFEASRRCLNAYRLFKLREDLTPHITLARVRRLAGAWSPEPLRVLQKETGRLGGLPVERLVLFRSREPGEAGIPYEALAELVLQA
jgi:2'-5' RNA ligase